MMITKKIRMGKPVLFTALILFPLLVAYSRIYLGSHYPFDVITGIVFGSLLSFIFAQIFFRFGRSQTQLTQ
jgi:undecaprenyl-diphosphatase